MRRLSWSLCFLLSGLTGMVRAADDPRALVERAVRACGGREVLAHEPAVYTRVRGELGPGAPGAKVEINGRIYADVGRRSRIELEARIGDDRHEMVTVKDGPRSWRRVDGAVTQLPDEELRQQEAWDHRERIAALLPLLDDKGFTLTPLGEVKVDGRPAAGVKVSYKGRADVRVYFDRATGLLVKTGFMEKDREGGRETLCEVVHGDYQDVRVGPAEERVLKGAGIDLTGSGLLDYLRSQSCDPRRLARARELVGRLGSDSFAAREQATRELPALGAVAVLPLEEAARDRDPEVARRTAHCLRKIPREKPSATLIAAVRLAAVRRPSGAAEGLLNVLPADEAVAREVKAALYALAQGGKPEADLVRALSDREPARRAAAAAALGKDGGAYLKEPGRRLYGRLRPEPMKMVSYRDGKREFELTTLEVEAFNRFEDRLFVKP
jgi:hypothetical protein